MIGVGQIQQTVALVGVSFVAAAYVIYDGSNVKDEYQNAVFTKNCLETLPVQCRQATTHKDKQVVEWQIVETIDEKVFSKSIPVANVNTRVSCPIVKGQLKAKEQCQSKLNTIFVDDLQQSAPYWIGAIEPQQDDHKV